VILAHKTPPPASKNPQVPSCTHPQLHAFPDGGARVQAEVSRPHEFLFHVSTLPKHLAKFTCLPLALRLRFCGQDQELQPSWRFCFLPSAAIVFPLLHLDTPLISKGHSRFFFKKSWNPRPSLGMSHAPLLFLKRREKRFNSTIPDNCSS
jgi:hypothetical protein